MPTITVQPDVYQQLQEMAQIQEANLDAIADEAFRLYLWEQHRQQIAREQVLYRQQYPELKSQFLGQYIAMKDGKVIDHDEELQTLYHRTRQRYGESPVLITQVQESADTILQRHGFRVDT